MHKIQKIPNKTNLQREIKTKSKELKILRKSKTENYQKKISCK